MLNDKVVLVTGGTGSFGQEFVKRIIKDNLIKKIIVYSRDELKQFEMQSRLNSPKLRYFLGDIRDYQRLKQATLGVDILIHAAAIKQISAAEYNPMEAIKTNIIGAENIVNVAIENKINKVVALSTDKAANPANLYGATKLCSDKLMIAGNVLAGQQDTRFSVVRYGNVLGSRGSVIPFFKEKISSGSIPITDIEMTRFWLTLERSVSFVLESVDKMHGGEIFIPKIPSFKVTDVAKIVAPNTPIKIIGIRPGEKLHEEMVTEADSYYTLEFESYYVILAPSLINSKLYEGKGKKVPIGFSFTSQNNKSWYTNDSFIETLKSAGI